MNLLRTGRYVLAALVCAVMLSPLSARDVTFFHISDQHYRVEEGGDKKGTTGAEKKFAKTIAAMNALPGTPWPGKIGGTVDRPRGVIMTGDLTDGGRPAEWDRWTAHWGFTGGDGLLDYPVYEGSGNHDGSSSSHRRGHVRRRIIRRNKERPAVVNVSKNGLHYSWDWDDVHFVQLNEYAGLEDTGRYPGNRAYGRKMQRYGVPAEKSLQFLRRDLAAQVGDSTRPVILLQHYGFGAFPFHPWGEEAGWWTEEQALRLWEAIEGYNVISILSGHDGSEAVVNWNGIPNRHMDDYVRFGAYHIGDDTLSFAQRNAKSGTWQRAATQSTRIDASLPPELVQGPYLVCGGTPGTMTVRWRTNTDVSCTLQWGDDRFRYEDGRVAVEPFNERYHLYSYTITDLKPNACVKYALTINGRYAPGMFYAPPTGARKVRFLVAGEQPDVASRNTLYKTLYDKIYADPACHSILLCPGDFVSPANDLRAWDTTFFSRRAAARHVRWLQSRMPLVVAPGDSAAARYLFTAEPADTAGYYSLDYGPVHVAVLNAEKSVAPGSAQHQWLQAALAATKAPWRVVMWNAPGAGRAARFRRDLQAVAAARDVDLCIIGNERAESLQQNGTTCLAPGTHSAAVAIEGDRLRYELFTPDGTTVSAGKCR